MAHRRFTASRDGVYRATVQASYRLTEEEYKILQYMAKRSGGYTFTQHLNNLLSDAIFRQLENYEKEKSDDALGEISDA